MIKTKESQLYLDFFRNSLTVILISGSLISLLSFVFLSSRPQRIIAQSDWQMGYQDKPLNDQITLTDQAVSLIRSKVLESQIGVNQKNEIKIFKSGPLLINLTDSGENRDNLTADIKNVDNYLKLNFPVTVVGAPIFKQEPKPFLTFALAGFLVGSLIGLLISLVKVYFRNY